MNGGPRLRTLRARRPRQMVSNTAPKHMMLLKTMAVRISIGACAATGLLLFAGLPARAAETVDLRGYGKVSAELTANRAAFTCENAEKADILLGKLLADLFWDKSQEDRQSVIAVHGKPVTVHSLPGQGSAAIARAGAAVVILGASDPRQVEVLAGNEPLLAGGDVTSRQAKPYPLYLDFYDNRALKAFVHPMHSVHKLGLDSHWPFLNIFGGGAAFLHPLPNFDSPAPGVIQWTATDYEVRQAEMKGGMVVPGPGGGGEAPLWEYNADPDHMMKASDATLLGQWNGIGMAGAHYESWGLPLETRHRLDLGFLRQAMERYRGSAAVGGWYVFAGSPGIEFGFHDRATLSWDQSRDGEASWRKWLRDIQHYSLAETGQRWHGDPKRFAHWEDVKVPDANEFFGRLGPDSFRISEGWRWRAAQAEEKNPPAADAPGWAPVEMPPSHDQLLLPASEASFFQTTFDPSAWRAELKNGEPGNAAPDVWLVFAGDGLGKDAARVMLNGVELEAPRDSEAREGPFAMRATGALKAGRNELTVRLKKARETSNGKLAGAVFLTRHEPKYMPYLGPGANARYSDFRQWQAWAIYEYHRDMIKLARRLDSDRPLILSGSSHQLFDHSAALAADFGMAVEHTGREAWYHPWWPGLGLIAGFYGAGEESGSARGDVLDREFSWIMFDADSSHTFFWDVEDYILRERQDGWFSNHRRSLELFGKYLRSKPGVVVFRSSESGILGKDSPNNWDIGRGELQKAHYDNGYAGERELKAGLLNDYPLLVDSGSEYMEPDTVAAIRKYVEAGGTFVAFHNTGVHAALEPDSSPISALTGFKASSEDKAGRIGFASDLPLFKGWEGRKFEGWGRVLSPAAPDAIPLARWADGGAAIGYRKIGKGRVIVLGSTFWRFGKDLSGVWRTPADLDRAFLEQLLTDAGVARNANATIPEIWARKMVTKNGLQDWLLAINSTESSRTADVWMRTDQPPDEVLDLQTNAPAPFRLDNGGVWIEGVNFAAYGVKTFAVKRRAIAAALPTWWREKTVYWKRAPEEIAAASASLPAVGPGSPNVMNFESWRFQPDPDGALGRANSWMKAEFNDASWKKLNVGPWSPLDPASKESRGGGVYRKKFILPPDWSNKRILLSLYSFDPPIVFDAGRFFVNGVPVAAYTAKGGTQSLNYDVTSKLHPGENVLAVTVSGGAQFAGLGGAIWLEAWQPLEEAIDLNSGWKLVPREGADPVEAPSPIRAKGRHLVRDFDAPAKWKGQTVYLELSSNDQWIRHILINGKPINYNSYAHPFGLWSRINLTPYLKPGEVNKLQLVSAGNGAIMQLNSIRAGALPTPRL